MSNTLAWAGAIGGIVAAAGATVAAVGAWRTEITARWQARVDRLRNDQARRENELHRLRHGELYRWWHDMPDGAARIRAMHWFGEWTGARDPYRGSDKGAIPPGFGCSDEDEAYKRYVGFLEAIFHPGRLGPPPRSLMPPDEPIPAPEQYQQRALPSDKLWLMSSACTPTAATIKTGQLLREARERAGISQRELAERLGCTQPAISQAEAGGASLSIATLQRIADALGYDLELAIVSRDVALNEGVPTRFRLRS